MMRWFVVLAVVISGTQVMVAAQAAHQCRGNPPAGTRCAESTISLRHPSEKRFAGDVDSHMRYCVRKRVVALRKVRKGPDRTVATTTTGKEGRWRVSLPRPSGRYYAVARFKERSYGIDSHDICYRARSRTLSTS